MSDANKLEEPDKEAIKLVFGRLLGTGMHISDGAVSLWSTVFCVCLSLDAMHLLACERTLSNTDFFLPRRPTAMQVGEPAAVIRGLARVLCAGARHVVLDERGAGGGQPQRLRVQRRQASQGVGCAAVKVALLGDELVDSA